MSGCIVHFDIDRAPLLFRRLTQLGGVIVQSAGAEIIYGRGIRVSGPLEICSRLVQGRTILGQFQMILLVFGTNFLVQFWALILLFSGII